MYDFFIYTGTNSTGGEKCAAESIVLQLAKQIPKHKQYRLFFDNWFSTLNLMIKLQTMSILKTVTLRANRLGNCPSSIEKDLKRAGRSSFVSRKYQNLHIHLVKWTK